MYRNGKPDSTDLKGAKRHGHKIYYRTNESPGLRRNDRDELQRDDRRAVSEQEAVDFITEILPAAKPPYPDSDLLFWRYDDPTMPSDAVDAYVYGVTYQLTGIIIYALTHYETVKDIPDLMNILGKALKGCMGKDFMGHGYDGYSSFVIAMEFFARSNINAFFKTYPGEFPEFMNFFQAKLPLLKELAADNIKGAWGESYAGESRMILELLSHEKCPIRIFVYGTLMKGQRAHHYLEQAKYIGDYVLDGYAMYNLGSYPGICNKYDKGKYRVIGEVYEISGEMLRFMDKYEDEGHLYFRRNECVRNEHEILMTYVYVYHQGIKGRAIKKKWRD